MIGLQGFFGVFGGSSTEPLSPYFFLRREIGFGYLNLLQFYLNHNPIQRSHRHERVNKTPAQLMSGKDHPHWLEMLGYQRFHKAA